MFSLNGLVQYAHRYRARRERLRLARIISNMSEDLRRDIGWPAPDSVSSDRPDRNISSIH